MTFRRASLSALIATSLVSAPVTASAAPVADRGGTPVEGEQLAGGLAVGWLIAAVLVVGLGILVFSDNDDDEEPASP